MPFSTSDLASQLGVDRATICRACKRIGIPKHGQSYLIEEEDVPRIQAHVNTSRGNPLMQTEEGQAKLHKLRRGD